MKLKMLIIVLIIVIGLAFFNINIVQAAGISDVITGGDSFIDSGKTEGNAKLDEEELQKTSNMIYNILLTIGVCIAVIVSSVLGIKFMIGSVEEKAQVKDALVPFVVGCIVIFGAFGFWKMFVTIGKDMQDPTRLDFAANYVSDDGHLYKKGCFYCNICKAELRSTDFDYKFCNTCHNVIKPCSNCNKKLSSDDFKAGKCRQCWTEVKDSIVTYYK